MNIFVDTSAWLAMNDKNDQYFSQAGEKIREIKAKRIELVTSEYIIDESITLIRFRISYNSAMIFGDSILNSNIIKILDVTKSDRQKAWEIFKKYRDKELSYTDCISFTLMKSNRIERAFTFDEHFKQIGFKII